MEYCTDIIGASEAKPLSSGWCENRKFGSLGGWVGLASCHTILYILYTWRPTIDGTYVVHIPILVHTSSLERALNPANRRGHLTRSSFHRYRGLHKATSGEVRRVRAVSSSSWLAVTADSYVYIVVLHTLFAASTRTAQGR